MAILPLKIGQPNSNLHQIQTSPLSKSSSRVAIMPQKVLDLLQTNRILSPGCFERFRAKTIAVVVGGFLPLIITALFGFTVYQVYLSGIFVNALQVAATRISLWAQTAFKAISNSTVTLAASSGGVLTLGYIITRPAVSSAIGSFFGSLFGSFTGTGIANLFKKLQGFGYDWWYDKYQFPQRVEEIKDNEKTIVVVLKDTYDEMGKALKIKEKSIAVKDLSLLKDRLPIIRAIMVKQGITQNNAEEITLEFEKSIESAFDIN